MKKYPIKKAYTLKELFFSKQLMEFIGSQIAISFPSFDQKEFLNKIFTDEFNKKEVKQRGHHVSEAINQLLNKPYLDSLDILLHVNKRLSFHYTNFVFPEFVGLYGLNHFHESMLALKEFTRNSTSEFAVRNFILQNEEDAMKYMYKWSTDENHHVRRLASEGCRPLLPWSYKLPQYVKDPTPILPILEILKEDPMLYVQKSVGNNLNDISKNHPELVLKICQNWRQSNNPNTNYIIKRACRTILKQGNQEALQLFGVGSMESIKVSNFRIHEQNVKIGGQVAFSFDIEDTTLLADQSSTNQIINQEQVNINEQVISQQDEELEQQNTITEGVPIKKKQRKRKSEEQKEEGQSEEDDELGRDQNVLRIEYKIDYLKKYGSVSSKVFIFRSYFKLPNKKVTLSGYQKVEQQATRIHYPGMHQISIIVNGVEKAKSQFLLEEKETLK